MGSDYIEAILFDLDGTLVDTARANHEAYVQAFTKLGFFFDDEIFKNCNGYGYEEMIDQMLPGLPNSDKIAIRQEKARQYSSFFHLLTENEPLIRLVKYFNSLNLPCALVTTASKSNAHAVLEYLGIIHCFKVIITSDDVKKNKPDAECYQIALNALGVQKNKTIVFEDSATGVAAALAAGLATLKVKLD